MLRSLLLQLFLFLSFIQGILTLLRLLKLLCFGGSFLGSSGGFLLRLLFLLSFFLFLNFLLLFGDQSILFIEQGLTFFYICIKLFGECLRFLEYLLELGFGEAVLGGNECFELPYAALAPFDR